MWTMARLRIVLLVSFLLLCAAAEAAPKPKKVKCKDKGHPCYKTEFYCPVDCPRTCDVDCASCQPVCTPPSPPPPLYIYSSPPPPPPVAKPAPPLPPVLTPPSLPPPTPPTTPAPPQFPPSPTTPGTPPSSEASGKKVRCRNRSFPHCYGMELTCPAGCPNQCEVDCVTCSPVCNCNRPGAVCQDPRFIGGDGITFYFHGKKDRDFCIVTDSNLHINAHFIGRRNNNMKRDFTWVQSLGILFNTHKFFIGAMKTATWNDAIDRLSLTFDDETILLPNYESATWNSTSYPGITITRAQATNAVEIEVQDNFKIKAVVVPITEKDSKIHKYGITEEDCFAHLDLSFKFYALNGDVNGVLGQTYASNYVSNVKVGALMPVLGGDKIFASSSLFATDCAVARFSGQLDRENSAENSEYANLNCATGLGGRGVVCKR